MAVVAALVLALEAIGFVLINIFLGMVVDKQDMSLGGIEPRAMTVSAVVAGGLFGAYLLLCAFFLVRAAARDTAPSGLPRVLLISCAVLHGLLGAFSVGLVGWLAFVVMMGVLGLLVWSLVAFAENGGAASGGGPDADGAPAPDGADAPSLPGGSPSPVKP
ncbi:hypothetical protein [Streptomyces sp. AJS327]|uniref:hypothetical protein n=1 Tax=Streptomyces sp. AJS327 TaxID=2545265 RepID=UPI0027E4AA7F|nr:hypothetical protein [Streptomyces sp. AJS327]